jgi:hypothetical protein
MTNDDGSVVPGHGFAPKFRPISIFRRQRNDAADPIAQFLAGLEMRHVLARQRDSIAGLRVAAGTRRAVVQGKAAEAADLDALAPASDPPIISSSDLTARSTSSAFRWLWRWDSISISSDLVMGVPILRGRSRQALRRPGFGTRGAA